MTYTETKNGQESAASPSLAIQIDTAEPSTPSCSSAPTPAKEGLAVTTTCAGVEQNSTLTVPHMACNPTPSDATQIVTCTGTTGHGIGEVSVSNDTVSVEDRAGNKNILATTGLIVDMSSPTQPTVTSPLNNSSTSNLNPVFTGTGESRSTVLVDDGNGHTCTSLVDTTNNWTCTVTPSFEFGDEADLQISQTDEAGNTSSPVLIIHLIFSPSGGGGVFTLQVSQPSISSIGSRDRNHVLERLAPMSTSRDLGPKFHEYESWQAIEECLEYNSERQLKFTDLHEEDSSAINTIKNTFILDPSHEAQYIISGYGTQKNDNGQSLFGANQSLSRLEWAKILMVSHCLPIYDYTLLPSVTAYGNPMPNYLDLPLLSDSSDTQVKWLLDLVYSASYYEIMHGTAEHEIQINREITGAEAIKMFIKTGEFVHGSEFSTSEEFSGAIDKKTWYYEYFAKAQAEGTLQKYINSVGEAEDPVLRHEAISLLLEALFKRNLYQSPSSVI